MAFQIFLKSRKKFTVKSVSMNGLMPLIGFCKVVLRYVDLILPEAGGSPFGNALGMISPKVYCSGRQFSVSNEVAKICMLGASDYNAVDLMFSVFL